MVAAIGMAGRNGLGGARTALIAGVSLFAVGAILAPIGLRAADEIGPLRLSIASLDVAGKRIVPIKPEAPPPVWRHTFGAERRGEAVRQSVRIPADIIALQGVTNVAAVRQMFPASSYLVVVSRQILQQTDHSANHTAAVATTALAIRRDTGLRMIAQDHLLDLAAPPPGAVVALAAATAVRLLRGGRTLWVVALDLAKGCPTQAAPGDIRCLAAERQLGAIDGWLAKRIEAGEAVIVAGSLHRRPDPGALPEHLSRLSLFSVDGNEPKSCAGSSMDTASIMATPLRNRAVTFKGRMEPVDEAAPEAGCFLFVDTTL